jgi:hypothetical protein
LADHFVEWVGNALTFDAPSGKYQTFLDSGLPLAEVFRSAWNFMRNETGAAAESIFASEACDAPGTAPPEDLNPNEEEGGLVRLQRLCTRARMRSREQSVSERMLLLPRNDRLRLSWDANIRGTFFTTLATASLVASGQEVCSMVATYMGIADPLLIRHEGREFNDRNSQSGPVRRVDSVIDVHGAALSAYLGKGHRRVKFHNDLEACGVAMACLVGFNARPQPSDVFTSAINPEQRQRFEGDQRRHARAHRGGLVADMAIGDFSLPNSSGVVPVLRQYDWKTIGCIPKFYGPNLRERAPDTRAASVAAEYEVLARKVDLTYNDVPRDQDGPVLNLLRSLPPVTPLAVGALGEWSRDVDQFIADLGSKGSSNPERFGCCHGAEQARGVISSHMSKCLGRVSLRGVARVRHAALKAVTGTPSHARGGAHADDHGAGNAWDAGARGHAPTPLWA